MKNPGQYPFPVPPTYQSVPDAVTVDRDGADYGGEPIGYPFPKGEVRVYRVSESDFTGRLTRVYPNGKKKVVASKGLVAPGGVAVARDGTLYVSNFSIFPGQGQLLLYAQKLSVGSARPGAPRRTSVAEPLCFARSPAGYVRYAL